MMPIVEFLESNGFLKMPLDNGKDSYHNIFSFGEAKFLEDKKYLVSVTIEGDDRYTFKQSHRPRGSTMTSTYQCTYLTEQELRMNLGRFFSCALQSDS